MNFINYTKELNEIAKNNQTEPEIVTEEDVIIAFTYLNNIYIEDAGDCLIFLSALNLCNTYVKQTNSKIGYTFKKGIKYLIDTLNYRNISDIYISKEKNNGTLILFQIGEIQFSFHDEKEIEINERYINKLSWDGVKKQKCAKTIFNHAINNQIRTTNKTFRGKNLKEKIEKTLENYKDKKITIEDLLILRW